MTALLAVLVGFDFTFYVLFHFSFFFKSISSHKGKGITREWSCFFCVNKCV